MKKILFSVLFLLCACMPDYEKAPVLKDYTRVPVLELPIARVDVTSEVGTMEREPHVERLMQMSPERFIKSWAAVRLRPNYQTENKAEFIIHEASMIQEDAPELGFFTYDNYKYTLKYNVELVIKVEDSKSLKSVEVQGFFARKLPKKASIDQRNNMFTQMLFDLENELDRQMPEQIRQKLLD